MREKKEEYWPLLDDGYGGTPSGADGGADGDPLRVLLFVLAAATLAVLGLSLAGCSRVQYVPVESVRTDTVRHVAVRADSTYLRDSIVIRLDTRADTVWRTEYRYRTHWRDRTVTDTLWRMRTDTVAVRIPVERDLTLWQRAQIWGFRVLAIALAAGLCIVYRKRITDWLMRRFM